MDDIGRPRHIVNYADVISDPLEEMKKIILHLREPIYGNKIDEGRLAKIIEKNEVKRRNYFSKFRFYDEDFFNELRDMIKDVPGIDINNDTLVIEK